MNAPEGSKPRVGTTFIEGVRAFRCLGDPILLHCREREEAKGDRQKHNQKLQKWVTKNPLPHKNKVIKK